MNQTLDMRANDMEHMAEGLDFSMAVSYHYDRFPPALQGHDRIIKPLSNAAAALARYDQMLKGMHSSNILLAPLRSQEAVISSRMEGTVSTLDEVLRYEADNEDGQPAADHRYRSEAIEVYLYARAMKLAQNQIKDGHPVSPWLIRSAHQVLLGFGRRAAMSPRRIQNRAKLSGRSGPPESTVHSCQPGTAAGWPRKSLCLHQ